MTHQERPVFGTEVSEIETAPVAVREAADVLSRARFDLYDPLRSPGDERGSHQFLTPSDYRQNLRLIPLSPDSRVVIVTLESDADQLDISETDGGNGLVLSMKAGEGSDGKILERTIDLESLSVITDSDPFGDVCQAICTATVSYQYPMIKLNRSAGADLVLLPYPYSILFPVPELEHYGIVNVTGTPTSFEPG
ncbi:hypothetical protein A2Z33_01875 [Candidatus Gottesmanbacteria bacterium RBG_16_52_11]|uniref:Uncharacterized protein n=1 Tax=Candidatus Gottesmanbacteria bacterium RBG_16_52_11 TaxID=1798374 RepID=A0A1F5YQX7_9BACT|nr:MAG: hypothetical protein A2Z33_01875 [Candidatus Gottesmanbacteria bacterium RBG_16_52_11]